MKEVREERFTNREDVGFNPAPIPPAPALSSREPRSDAPISDAPIHERPVPVPVRPEALEATTYVITAPRRRRKTRQSFNIFEDQCDALKKIQLAEADVAEQLHNRTLSELVQEALDAFIKEKTKKLGNISIKRGHE